MYGLRSSWSRVGFARIWRFQFPALRPCRTFNESCLSLSVPVWLCVCLSLCLCVCISVCVSMCVCLSVCLSACLSGCLSVSLSFCISVFLCLYLCPSVRPSVRRSCPSVGLVRPSVTLCTNAMHFLDCVDGAGGQQGGVVQLVPCSEERSDQLSHARRCGMTYSYSIPGTVEGTQ